ncbi:MAG: carboxypeptidase regulatory-like domain-containing protein [Phycisphaerae bacterium]|nr:carboxypeptidase regulatory-like domain-containing protein [Phycisphaerae bacterium]
MIGSKVDKLIVLLISLCFCGINLARESEVMTCTGKVADAKGRPIAGATVSFHQLVYNRATHTSDTALEGEVTTEADGKFSFSGSSEGDRGLYGYIVAEKEGLALSWANWNMRKGSIEIGLELGRPEALMGTVVDENNKPVPQAKVSVYMLKTGEEGKGQYLPKHVASKLFTTHTDRKGNFTFTNLPAEATADFLFTKEGRAKIDTWTTSARLTYAVGQSGIKLVLPPEARIHGVVLEKATGKPVSGVRLLVKDDRNHWAQEPFDSRDDGTFSIASLARRRYRLELMPPMEKLAQWVAEPVDLLTETGKTRSGVRVEVSKGGVFEVVVTDAISGEPVEKAHMGVWYEMRRQFNQSLSGKDGIAQIRLLPGEYVLLDGVTKQGYSPQAVNDTITIEDGRTERREYAFFPDSKITGTVRSERGRPTAGATLMVWPSERQKQVVADAQGKFTLAYEVQNLSGDGVPVLILCRYEEGNLACALQIDGDMRTLDITLKPGVTFTGKVVDPDGKGIGGARLRLDLHTPGLSWPIGPTGRNRTATDEAGRFRIKAVPTGHKYSLHVEAKGHGRNTSEEINADNVAGNRLDMGNMTLAVANLSVSGVVVDDNDSPVAGVRVNTYSSNQPSRRADTDADGRFILDGVCAGRTVILATKFGTSLHGSVIADVGTTDARIVLSERSSRPRYVPKQPPLLAGRPLPDLKKYGIASDSNQTKDKVILVCFWDMNQRPSRHCITQLAKRAEQLGERGVIVVSVQAAKVDEDELSEWVKKYNISFPVGAIATDHEKTRFALGVRSLPWLILTDERHIVTAEGFSMAEFDQRLNSNSNR